MKPIPTQSARGRPHRDSQRGQIIGTVTLNSPFSGGETQLLLFFKETENSANPTLNQTQFEQPDPVNTQEGKKGEENGGKPSRGRERERKR